MTTPVTPDPEGPPPPADLGTQQAAAAQEAATGVELNELAKSMQKMANDAAANGFEIRKGVVVAISDSTSPPTCSINISGDTETLISDVRIMQNYAPQVGQTCLVAKQGPDIFLIGATAAGDPHATDTTSDNGWVQATLAAGSHDGNSNGAVYYRRILDHGSWKIQWRGGWTVSGTTMVTALPVDCRPASKRSVLVSRDTAGGAVSAQLDFATSGAVTLVGGTTSPAATVVTGTSSTEDPTDTTTSTTATGTISSTTVTGTSSTEDPVDTTTSTTAGGTVSTENPGSVTSTVDPNDSTTTDSGHSHGVVGGHFHTFGIQHGHTFTGTSHSHGVTGSHDHTLTMNSHGHTFTGTSHSHGVTGSHDHTLTMNSHGHAVTAPTWISLNGVEYFL